MMTIDGVVMVEMQEPARVALIEGVLIDIRVRAMSLADFVDAMSYDDIEEHVQLIEASRAWLEDLGHWPDSEHIPPNNPESVRTSSRQQQATQPLLQLVEDTVEDLEDRAQQKASPTELPAQLAAVRRLREDLKAALGSRG